MKIENCIRFLKQNAANLNDNKQNKLMEIMP